MPDVTLGLQPVYGLPGAPRAFVDRARDVLPTSNVGYNGISYITDGSDAIGDGATQITKPQYVQVDLGRAIFVRSTRMLFTDTAHCCKTGSLQSSSDGTNFTTEIPFAGDVSLDRTLPVNVRARYWRINTTDSGSAGTGVNIYTWSLFG